MQVIKRDGRKKNFEIGRISDAIRNAYIEVYGEDLEMNKVNEIHDITLDVDFDIEHLDKDEINVEEIQDIVVENIKQYDKIVANTYQRYREKREIQRSSKMFEFLRDNIINKTSEENANANLDENSFSGKEDIVREIVFNRIVDTVLPKDILEAEQKGELKIHDRPKFALGEPNCLQLNWEHIIKETGFMVRQGDTRPTTHYETATQLLAVSLQIQSQQQYGGCSIPNFSLGMVDILKSTISDVSKMIVDILDLEIDIPKQLSFNEAEKLLPKKAYTKMLKYLNEKVRRANQALITNLVTLLSRSGNQLPFSSINFGLIDWENERESAYLIEMLLLAIDKGVGKYGRSAIFPVSCFQVKSGVNRYPQDKYYYLRMTAQRISHKRLYPTFVNGDFSHNVIQSPNSEMNIMGCRTMMGFDRFNPTEPYIKVGRGNNAPNTINLPYIALETGNEEDFFKRLDEVLLLSRKTHLIRWEIMKKQPPTTAPFTYENKTILGAEDCIDTVENALKHGSFAFGYIGVAEACKALTGHYHNQTEEAKQLGERIIKHIYDFCKKYEDIDNLNYSVYASPAEGYCKKACDFIKRDFGIIEGISDKDFITNSHHVPVTEGENVFKKIDIESEYGKWALGGNILHVEVDGVNYNEKAITRAIDYALEKDVPYIRISHPIATCMSCSHSTGRYMDKCEVCDSENVENLAIVTGYLSTDISHMNTGKQDEVSKRELNIK